MAYNIKPYIKYADSRPHAVCGYVDHLPERTLKVVLPEECSSLIEDKTLIPALVETLSLDPRPSYQDDPERVYGMDYGRWQIKFKASGDKLIVTEAKERKQL